MLIEKLGEDYAADTLQGTFFLYDGRPCKIRSINRDDVLALDLTTNTNFSIDPTFFTGWRELKYPRLGYRKLDNGLWGWVVRTPRSYSRGLDRDNLRILTPPYLDTEEGAAWFREAHGFNPYNFGDMVYEYTSSAHSLMKAALAPVYDKGEQLVRVLRGEDKSFIPSERYMVEPIPFTNKFGVYMSGSLIGRVDKDMNVYAPKKNIRLIEDMVKRYAA